MAFPAMAVSTLTDNGNGTVTDSRTGLVWMRCAMGQTWDTLTTSCIGTASPYTWTEANALTHTVTFAGQSDWRLPNVRELQTIVDQSRAYPSIDSTAFSNTPQEYFWTASTSALESNLAWAVYISDGQTAVLNKDLTANVNARLVRAGHSTGVLRMTRPDSDYIDHQNGTLTHKSAGLMWQRCSKGQDWTTGGCTGTEASYTWTQAAALTDNLAGFNDPARKCSFACGGCQA